MKRAISSFTDLFQSIVSEKDAYITKSLSISHAPKDIIIELSEALTKILKSSKGRDKVCGIIQYLSDFYSCCSKYSTIDEERILYLNNLAVGALIAHRIKSSLSQARKIFRFLKFVGEIQQIKKIMESKKPITMKILLTVSHAFSFLYYILDNVLWMMNVGIFKDIINDIFISKTKEKKNLFSLFKVILQITLCSIFYYLRDKKEHKMIDILYLKEQDKIINIDDDTYDICRAILRQRQKKKWEGLDLFLSTLRVVMLLKSLKLKSVSFNPIFVSFCGIISSSLSLFKLINKTNISNKNELIKFSGKNMKDSESEQTLYEMSKKRILKSSSYLITSSTLKCTKSTCYIDDGCSDEV